MNHTAENTSTYKLARCLKWVATLLLLISSGVIGGHTDIIVDQNGKGDYTTITKAIDALPMFAYQRVVIEIKNGIYEEKLRLTQNYLTLRGESRDSTIIRFSILRSDWIENKDFIGPAVINIHNDDIILENLTIENTQPVIGPHAFAIYGTGTRTIIINCNILSKGGDTVSLWNYKDGMYYHANCRFEGAVDFVCPRGWCFIRDSQFYQVKKTATLWHAGGFHPDQKLVVRNSTFDGVPGFYLGRHHYDAQFYLLDCTFSENMADRPIYRHTYTTDIHRNNPAIFTDRYYFYNSRKAEEQFHWLKNNLESATGRPTAETITPLWTFQGKWDPENTLPVTVTASIFEGHTLQLTFNEIVSVRGTPCFVNAAGKKFQIYRQRFLDINKLTFIANEAILPADLSSMMTMIKGDIIASVATVKERSLGSVFKIPGNVE